MDKCFLYDRCNHVNCDKSFCMRKYKMENLYRRSLLQQAQWAPRKLTLAENSPDIAAFSHLASIEKDIITFVREGNQLFIHSSTCGNGKTSWSLKLAQAYLNRIWITADETECKVLFINVPTLLGMLKDDIRKPDPTLAYIKNNIKDADLVIWDDIANKMSTEFEATKILEFLEPRVAGRKSNIFTSNLDINGISGACGQRISSRMKERSIDIVLNGPDRRGTVGVGGNK